MRALHVVDAGSWRWEGEEAVPDGRADVVASACSAVVAAGSDTSTVLVLGPAWFARRAAGLGLRDVLLASAPKRRPELAWRAVAEAARRATVACCWSAASERAAILARSLSRQSFPIVRVGLEPPADAPPPWPRRLSRRSAVSLHDVLPLAAADDAVLAGARRRLRRELGLSSEVVVLLLGTHADASAVRFAFLLGLARYVGDQVVGLAPSWSHALKRAERFQRRLSNGVRLLSSSTPLEDLRAAADAAVWIGDGHSSTWLAEMRPSRLAVAQCLAAGVPVIAPRRAGLEDLYPPEVSAGCLAELAMPPELARVLLPLLEDPEKLGAVGESCREFWRGRGAAAAADRVEHVCQQAAASGAWGAVISTQMVAATEGSAA